MAGAHTFNFGMSPDELSRLQAAVAGSGGGLFVCGGALALGGGLASVHNHFAAPAPCPGPVQAPRTLGEETECTEDPSTQTHDVVHHDVVCRDDADADKLEAAPTAPMSHALELIQGRAVRIASHAVAPSFLGEFPSIMGTWKVYATTPVHVVASPKGHGWQRFAKVDDPSSFCDMHDLSGHNNCHVITNWGTRTVTLTMW